MRTLSNVRTRLRGTPDATTESHDSENGNGDAPVQAPAPMDPLLVDPPTNGHHDLAEATVTAPRADDTIVEAPPEFEPVPTETVPADVPLDRGGLAGERAASPVIVAPRPRPRRQRIRPALPLLRRRPRVRKVTRIVRRVDAWGVFKISVIFYVILYIILLVAGILLWNLANTTGTVANVEGFARDLFGLKTFEFDGEKLFRASWVLGAVLVIAGTGLNVVLAVLFNLISDLVGGVRVTVLEEEVILRERPAPRPVEPLPDPEGLAPPEVLPPPEASEAVDEDAPGTASVS